MARTSSASTFAPNSSVPGSRRTPSASGPATTGSKPSASTSGGDRGDVAGSSPAMAMALRPGVPARPGLVLEVVVAHVVERLDHARLGQERLDDLAGRGARVGEVVADAVDLPPVVHRVDDELAAQRVDRDGAVLAEREGEDRRRRRATAASAAVVAIAPGVRTSTVSAIFARVAGARRSARGSRRRRRAGRARCRPCRRRGCRASPAIVDAPFTSCPIA